ADGVVAVAVEGQGVPRLAGGFQDRFGDAHGGSRRRVFLETVMGLDDFDVVVVAEQFGDFAGDLEQQVHAQAHVGGLQDRDIGGGLVDDRMVGGLQARGADDHRNL